MRFQIIYLALPKTSILQNNSNSRHSLFPLYSTNFLGVLGDNLLKSLICFVSVHWFSDGYESTIIMLATGLMVLPFIVVSPFAGYLSKVLNKRKTVIILKFAEILIMGVAVFGFYIENIYVVLTAMFFMGLQSTFFSPMKFALVRDMGGVEKSSVGTGTVEMTTFFGVLIGTFVAGIVSDSKSAFLVLTGIVFMCNSLLGFLSAVLIRANEPKPLTLNVKPLNFVKFLLRKYNWAKKTAPGLNTIVVALSLFWMIASLIQMNLYRHCEVELKLSATETGILLAVVAVSIGLGSYISGLLSRDRILLELVPYGGVFFISSILLIYFIKPTFILFSVFIIIAAFTAGFFKTPMNAWMQVHVKGRQLGDAVAYNNLMNFIFILASAGIFGLVENNFGTYIVFLVVAFLSVLLIVYVSLSMPEVRQKLRLKRGEY